MASDLQGLAAIPNARLRQTVRGLSKWFQYTTPPVVIPAITGVLLGVVETVINIDGDAHFMVTALTGSYLINATGVATNPILSAEPRLQIIDQSTGAALFDRPQVWGNILGSGRHAFRFEPPYLFRARSAVTVRLENPETVAYSAEVSFIGYKVYLS